MSSFLLGVMAGYVLCVLVPLPGVSRFVLDSWAALGAWIKAKTTGNGGGA